MKVSAVLLALTALVGCARTGPHDPPGEPAPGGEVRQEVKAAWAIAKRLLDHYRPEGLDRFTDDMPGEFEPLVKAGVLTEEDGRAAAGEYRSFTFRRSAAYSRRYEFTFYYVPGRHAGDALAVELNHQGEPVRGDASEEDVSTDLAADVNAMWAVDGQGRSPPEAIPVASRVFNTVNLVGLHRDKIAELVGNPRTRRPGGVYNFPFWPSDRGDLVFRFDTGAYGWQFNVKLDAAGVCTAVDRRWIH
jgi:hypothetical protein